MPYPNRISIDQHSENIEPVGVVTAPVALDPDAGRPAQLLLLLPVDRLHRIAKPVSAPSLHLDERHETVLFHHEVDVTMPAPEASLHHPPPPLPKPSLRYPLTELPKCLPGR
jgi:hypothetical protein